MYRAILPKATLMAHPRRRDVSVLRAERTSSRRQRNDGQRSALLRTVCRRRQLLQRRPKSESLALKLGGRCLWPRRNVGRRRRKQLRSGSDPLVEPLETDSSFAARACYASSGSASGRSSATPLLIDRHRRNISKGMAALIAASPSTSNRPRVPNSRKPCPSSQVI
jgi:hypothetical protein